MRIIKQIESVLAKIEGVCLTIILSLMILFSFGQVILRNVFHEGILWADIFLRQLVLWVGFLGASLGARAGRHIAIDFLPNVLPPSWRRATFIIVNLAAGVISAFLAAAAWDFVLLERDAESVLFLDIPVWIFQAILPYAFVMISLRFLLNTVIPAGSVEKAA